MQKTFLVMKQELRITFSRPSFLGFAFGIPVLALLIFCVVKIVQYRSTLTAEQDNSSPSTYQFEREGFTDHSGLITTISEDISDYLIPFENETLAIRALQDGEISSYYIVPMDYIERGEVQYVYPDGKPFLSSGQEWVIKRNLILNLLHGNVDLADQIWNPIRQLDVQYLAPQDQNITFPEEGCTRPGSICESNKLIQLIPSMMVALFFIAFTSSSSTLFSSIGAEKENRTIELLMVSIKPRQLLAGKTAGLGIAGLSQTTMWVAVIYIIFNVGGNTLQLPDEFIFPAGIMVWSLVFFLGGFGLYASLMAGAGALVPKMKEAGIANFLAMIPLFFGYAIGLIAPLAGSADTNFLVILSIFPFTSPVVMIMRLTVGNVPGWQVIISICLLFITAFLILRIVAAMFNTQNLLSGQPFSVKRYLMALTGRV